MVSGREHSEHDVVQELLGAYALDAVDAAERARVEAHLATCRWCQTEVAEHQEVAALLSRADAAAPPQVWERIEAAVTPPPLRAPGSSSRRRPMALWLSAAAAVVAVASLSVAVLDAGDADGGDAPVSLAEAAAVAVADPAAVRAELRAPSGDVLAYAVVLPEGDGYLLPSGLPAVDNGVYQLWGRGGDDVVSLGVFDGQADVVAFHAAAAALDEIMVTHEDAPVAQTANVPVVRGNVA